MIDYSLYLVTDDPSRYAGNWLDNIVAAVEGGVTCVQYRDTESAPDVRLARVRALQDALKRFGTPLIVNNEAELALAVHAEGVHVGQHDMPPAAVRRIVGPKCEIGLSITEISQLAQLGEAGRAAGADGNCCVDALGIGPVFDARQTKADASEAMGIRGLKEIVDAVLAQSGRAARWSAPTGFADSTLPIVAIGGITLANAADVLSTGVDGLAVVSAFSKSEDPRETARAFGKCFTRRRGGAEVLTMGSVSRGGAEAQRFLNSLI